MGLPAQLKDVVEKYSSLSTFPRAHLLSHLVHLNDADMNKVEPYDIIEMKSLAWKDGKWTGSLVKNHSQKQSDEDSEDEEEEEEDDTTVQQPSSKPAVVDKP